MKVIKCGPLIIALVWLLVLYLPLQTCRAGAWGDFKKQFLQQDGRIIDRENSSISHSEGQGYGLIVSWSKDDKETFYKIWNWTKRNLQKRCGDHLLCWSWGKRPNGKWQVIDYNNATDGDICVAYALFKASEKWRDPELRKEGLNLTRDIRENLGLKWGDYLVLLPGYYGFTNRDWILVNPSYIFLKAYELFSRVDQKAFWLKAFESGRKIISQARFSDLMLPPDWLCLGQNGSLSLYKQRGYTFGFDAIRVFLFGYYGDSDPASKIKQRHYLQGLAHKIMALGYLPSTVDLMHDCYSTKHAPAGFYLILARAMERFGLHQESSWFLTQWKKTEASEKNPYYSSILSLLAESLK